MIEFTNVSKTYPGGVKAIDDISLSIGHGEFVVLLGPSGCGKTTLLRMVNQLEELTEGEIAVEGSSIHDLNKIDMRRNIGYVIQSNGLFPNMTIEDNVMVVPAMLGWSKEKKKERFEYLMNLIGMPPETYRKNFPHELSGGQQQRIGVARALAADPPVMLMDEPFGALDPIIRARIQEEFLDIQRTLKKTILFVSHDIDEAIKLADRIVLLKDGKLQQFDRPEELLNRPANEFVSEFVGEDSVLKSLSLYQVQDMKAKLTLPEASDGLDGTVFKHGDSLRYVLSHLLHPTPKPVYFERQEGGLAGPISVAHIEAFVREMTA
ncbi:osmoprotectant transport system ATP-binding protein [Salsuginibacillus halophilus]|uniref:Carnitine transport ATP-binding protein OpuCA n=1 Tax=Salsuginibacillus halophilus TaxID=517424 RepID=A0A2P8HL57_9BACI|nr:ABC transporter ATP-binding protein [Salsuginibacillus halophilus]PSL46954.1 osmoprotectant transport system ATP-binding protein [Salsuginibacillus halophilus]